MGENRSYQEAASAASVTSTSTAGWGYTDKIESTSFDKALLAQFQQQLELLPDKEAYLEAMERAPFLVEMESPAFRFLKREDFDPKSAALRLVAYWRERKEIFGDRAFLPMDLTGKGALTEQDISVVDTKFFSLLEKDKEKRSVLFFNRVLLGDKIKYPDKLRIRPFFYVVQLISETSGEMVIVSNHNDISNYSHSRGRGPMGVAATMMKCAIPIKIAKIHMCCLPPDGTRSTYLGTILSRVVQMLGLLRWGRALPVLHIADTKEEIFKKIEAFGFTKKGIPEMFGGSWTYDSFERDQLKRRPIEEERHKQFEASLLDRKSSAKPGGAQVAAPFRESSEVQEKALTALEEAIQLIPQHDKAAFMEARGKIPAERMNTEASPIRFLRMDNYNTWAAAQRLALYWKCRKQLFGSRAFLPMNQTGEGTLNRDDSGALARAFFSIMPNDHFGRCVLRLDPSKRADTSTESRKRVIFYIMSIACENDMTQKDGVVIMNMFSEPQLDQTSREMAEIIKDALPCRLHRFHIINTPDRSGKKSAVKVFLNTFVPAMLNFVGRDAFIGSHAIVHAGKDNEDLVQELSRHGLTKDHLPTWMGGAWEYEGYMQWLDLRLRYEWNLPVTAACQKYVDNVPNYKAKQFSELTEEEKTERRRRMNVYHSRRKRVRQKIESEVLNDQVLELKHSNEKLVEDNRRLEELIEKANVVVKEDLGSVAASMQPVLDTVTTVPSSSRKKKKSSSNSATEPDYRPTQRARRDSFQLQPVMREAAPRQPPLQQQSLSNPQNLSQVRNVLGSQTLLSLPPSADARLAAFYLSEAPSRDRFGATYPQGQHLASSASAFPFDHHAAATQLRSEALAAAVSVFLQPSTQSLYRVAPGPSTMLDPTELLEAMRGYGGIQSNQPQLDLLSNSRGVPPSLANSSVPLDNYNRSATGGIPYHLQQQLDRRLWEPNIDDSAHRGEKPHQR